MRYLCRSIILLILVGCSHYGSIGLKNHRFETQPKKIIWLHFPGLSEEHISLLKFFYENSLIKTSFEKALCFGQLWQYNIYKLRPRHNDGFLSQVLGTQNIKGECGDYKGKPIWDYLSESGYDTGILERVVEEEHSLERSKFCKEDNFLRHAILWKMKKTKSANFFHAKKKINFRMGEVYYDESCKGKNCYHSLLHNVKSMIEQGHFKDKSKYLFIIRDDSLYQNFFVKNLDKSKDHLLEVERIFDYLLELQKNEPNMLVLLTSSESIPIELPKRGEGWRELNRNKNNLIYKNSSLFSPVWAIGARAENYCGLYEEAEIFHRTLYNIRNKTFQIFGIQIM